ncbi:Uncharacterised protein [Mycobacteroides abscessus]|nr:Uncharacterised protein [Mycobacteroides abscessus]
MLALPVTLYQRVPDEQLAGQLGIDLCVTDAAAWHQGQTVESHPFKGHHGSALGIPVRLAVGPLDQIPGEPFHGLRFDTCGDATEQTTGFHQIGHHHPAWRLFGQHRAGSEHELGVARAGIVAGIALTQTDV